MEFPLTTGSVDAGPAAETALAVAAPANSEPAVLHDEPSSVMLELTPLQQQAIELFLMGKTQAEVGLALNRTDRTMRNWLALPAFRNALYEGNAGRLHEAGAMICTRTAWAIRRLEYLASAEGVTDRAQVAAAQALVNLTLKLTNEIDLTNRVSILEKELDERDEEEQRERR